jgi:wyosine [tRNA(Phe)-imidazoG37] synthetase (radical SAM superfamily)
MNNTIFGPIPSRRFGLSLGVDLSPSIKQCNFDCLYCELAPMATQNRQTEVVEVATILDELKKHCNQKIDVITLTANGEPTLYPHLDKLIDGIDAMKGTTQTLILTNSATLNDARTFNTLLKLDQVKLSLDAVTPEIFKKIDRPHEDIKIQNIVESLIRFSHAYKGKLFIEILFVHGLNDTKEEVAKLNEVLLQVQANRIDLGTIDRPPAYPVVGLSYKELHEIAMLFDAKLPVHIASRTHAEPNNAFYTQEEILNTLDKRPLTQDDIALLFDDASQKTLHAMIEEKKISIKTLGNLHFYVPTENTQRKRQK